MLTCWRVAVMHDFCLTIPYGMLVMCGGAFGFLVAGSRASLIAGGASGGILTLLGYGGYWEYKRRNGETSSAWTVASLAVSGALTVMMGKRFQKTGKVMPSIPVAVVSLGMSLFYCYQLVKAKPPAKKSS